MADIPRNLLIKTYFDHGFTDEEIRFILHHEHSLSISVRQIKRIRQLNGLSKRDYIEPALLVEFVMSELSRSGQLHGYRIMYAKCLQQGLRVRVEDVRNLLRQIDPNGVDLRLHRRLTRRAYFAEGPNYIWHIDGYDKLKPYGLAIHGCIDGFSREVIWLNVYRTNNNPKVIGGYFIEAIKEYKGCPRIVRTDYGTENGHIQDFQRFLRRDGQDPQANICYIDGASTANQRIEMWWGFLRKECVQFWMEHFRALTDRGHFGGNLLDKSLVQFCFMAILQHELDTITQLWNSHRIRPSRNPRVPCGRPTHMFHVPGLWGAVDKLYHMSDDNVAVCKEECEFRSAIPCDEDVYDACIQILLRDDLELPTDMQYATDLYLFMRYELGQ